MEHLAPSDVAFLYHETSTEPQHIGAVSVFETPAAGFDYDRLVRLLDERISLTPRYRQKLRAVPGHIAAPVWVDDPGFDLTYHVRRSALPRPGTDAQLLEFCARIQSRRLDRSRPLWEMYLVEGLERARLAIVTKTHAAMVGEDSGLDIAQVILDAAPTPRRTVELVWMPRPEPSGARLVSDAVRGIALRPAALIDTVRAAGHDVRMTTARAAAVLDTAVSAAEATVRRRPAAPLHAHLSEQRRLAVARTGLADYRTVRRIAGGTVNDIVLAVVTGALREWLVSRATPMNAATTVRALVPMSVDELPDPDRSARDPQRQPDGATRAGTVRALLLDLPVGEPDPVLRLARVRAAMASHRASGRAVGAHRLTTLAGFAPPTMMALAARASGQLASRLFDVVVTNVPGPQVPLYAAGARMIESFPVMPLQRGHVLSVALTSYDGVVCYGINADRDAASDVELLAGHISRSLSDLVTAVRGAVELGPVGGGRTVRLPRPALAWDSRTPPNVQPSPHARPE